MDTLGVRVGSKHRNLPRLYRVKAGFRSIGIPSLTGPLAEITSLTRIIKAPGHTAAIFVSRLQETHKGHEGQLGRRD